MNQLYNAAQGNPWAVLLIIAVIALVAGLSCGVVDLANLFPSVQERGHAMEDASSRALTGNGGNVLMLRSGNEICRNVTSVRIGDQHLPATMDEEYPVSFDSNGVPKLETVTLPMYIVIETPDGPALQRSVKTNDGIWQGGAAIHVSGEWVPVGTPAAPPVVEKPERAKPTEEEIASLKDILLGQYKTAEELAKGLNGTLDSAQMQDTAFLLGLEGFTSKKTALEAISGFLFPVGN